MTRVARVTGLDRAGVEVACAVRPGGHVLQISNGKGETWEQARASALSEAAELWAAERVDPAELVHGAQETLPSAWEPLALVAPRLWSPRTRIAWRRAAELMSGEEVLVPAQEVHCPPAGSLPLGPAVARWSTNGMGAHPQRDRALLHALLEAVERDQLSRALPQGWTARALRERKIAAQGPLCARLREARFEVHVFDLSGPLGVPVAGAILVDPEEGPVPVTSGYACALSREDAVRGALLEAAQSRLTDVHGAREDVVAQDREAARGLWQACARVEAQRRAGADRGEARGRVRGSKSSPAERSRPDASAGVRAVLRQLRQAGFSRAAAVELAPPGFPLHVVKVLVPGLLVSELL